MMFPKQRPFRSRRYLDWVKTQPCVVHGVQADDPHHIIGVGEGRMGSTASDLYAFPLTRGEHNALHEDVEKWEQAHGPQWRFVSRTIEEAVRQGILKVAK